jgi:outer membrane receptor protein involved in Fe transport
MPIWAFDSGRRVGSTFAFRSSDYEMSGVQDSWKIGFDADLMSTLRWRATKSHDIREPNFAEVFLTGTGGGSVIDRFRNNEQNNALTVLAMSNPALGAETGDTITTGFVWQPDFANWIDGLQVSVDWYDIDLSNAVTPYGAQRIVDDCFASGLASVCDLIQRLPPGAGQTYGPISRILNQNINADRAQTRGVDLEFIWSFDPDFVETNEGLQIRGLLGRLHENSTTTAAGTTRDEAGSQTRPVYSGIITGTYTMGKWGLTLQGDYYHRTMNNITWVDGVDVDDNWVAAQTTFSFASSYRTETQRGMGWGLSFNITNLTDEAPSIVANATGQTIVMGHDALGRRYQVSFNMDF